MPNAWYTALYVLGHCHCHHHQKGREETKNSGSFLAEECIELCSLWAWDAEKAPAWGVSDAGHQCPVLCPLAETASLLRLQCQDVRVGGRTASKWMC